MLMALARRAHRLDLWLQAKLGRPYHVLLSVGIITEIARRVLEFPKEAKDLHRLGGVILLVLLNLALLLHQVGALTHHFQGRGRGRRNAAEGDPHPRSAGPEEPAG